MFMGGSAQYQTNVRLVITTDVSLGGGLDGPQMFMGGSAQYQTNARLVITTDVSLGGGLD